MKAAGQSVEAGARRLSAYRRDGAKREWQGQGRWWDKREVLELATACMSRPGRIAHGTLIAARREGRSLNLGAFVRRSGTFSFRVEVEEDRSALIKSQGAEQLGWSEAESRRTMDCRQ